MKNEYIGKQTLKTGKSAIGPNRPARDFFLVLGNHLHTYKALQRIIE